MVGCASILACVSLRTIAVPNETRICWGKPVWLGLQFCVKDLTPNNEKNRDIKYAIYTDELKKIRKEKRKYFGNILECLRVDYEGIIETVNQDNTKREEKTKFYEIYGKKIGLVYKEYTYPLNMKGKCLRCLSIKYE